MTLHCAVGIWRDAIFVFVYSQHPGAWSLRLGWFWSRQPTRVKIEEVAVWAVRVGHGWGWCGSSSSLENCAGLTLVIMISFLHCWFCVDCGKGAYYGKGFSLTVNCRRETALISHSQDLRVTP